MSARAKLRWARARTSAFVGIAYGIPYAFADAFLHWKVDAVLATILVAVGYYSGRTDEAASYYALKEQHEADARIAAVVREPSNDERDSIRLAMDAAYDEGTDGIGITNAALAAIIALADARAEKPR